MDCHGDQSGGGGDRGVRGEFPDHDFGTGRVAASHRIHPAYGLVVVEARAAAAYLSGTWEAPDADLRGWVALFFWGFAY